MLRHRWLSSSRLNLKKIVQTTAHDDTATLVPAIFSTESHRIATRADQHRSEGSRIDISGDLGVITVIMVRRSGARPTRKSG